MSFPRPETILAARRAGLQNAVDAALRDIEAQLRDKAFARYFDRNIEVLNAAANTVRAAGWDASVTPGGQREPEGCLEVRAP